MDMLKVEIMRLAKNGTTVNRYEKSLRDQGYKGFEIDDMCQEIAGQDLGLGFWTSNLPERSFCLGQLTERGLHELSDSEAELAEAQRQTDEINAESYRDMY